ILFRATARAEVAAPDYESLSLCDLPKAIVLGDHTRNVCGADATWLTLRVPRCRQEQAAEVEPVAWAPLIVDNPVEEVLVVHEHVDEVVHKWLVQCRRPRAYYRCDGFHPFRGAHLHLFRVLRHASR